MFHHLFDLEVGGPTQGNVIVRWLYRVRGYSVFFMIRIYKRADVLLNHQQIIGRGSLVSLAPA